jgi:hypothetical protein
MDTQDEDRDVFQSQYFDPFPEPQTIPAGWNTSEILATPQIDSVMEEENSAEG